MKKILFILVLLTSFNGAVFSQEINEFRIMVMKSYDFGTSEWGEFKDVSGSILLSADDITVSFSDDPVLVFHCTDVEYTDEDTFYTRTHFTGNFSTGERASAEWAVPVSDEYWESFTFRGGNLWMTLLIQRTETDNMESI